MSRKALSVFLVAAAFFAGAAAAQTVRAPVRTGPSIAVDPVPVASLQSDLSQLTARVAALEAGMAQLADRVTALNEQVAALEEAYGDHRHSFTDNSVAYENLTVANQQVSRITGLTGTHDLTEPPP
jgi:hypothetical protein